MSAAPRLPVAYMPVTILCCKAPHPDPRKAGRPCSAPLGHVPGYLEFITTAERAPAAPDGTVWLPCPRHSCGKWNRYRIVAPPAGVASGGG